MDYLNPQTWITGIVHFFLSLLWYFLAGLFYWLPTATTALPAETTASVVEVFTFLKTWSVVVPWSAPLGGIRLLLISTAIVYSAMGAWYLINLILNRLWGHH